MQTVPETCTRNCSENGLIVRRKRMNTIITIGRQFGSGGREIGEKVAKRLGYAFYDKEILTMAAEESGFSPAARAAFARK